MTIRRGDVYWVADARGRRRPGLVLTRDTAIGLLNRVLVAPATRTVRDIPTEVRLGPEDGMPEACAVTLDNVRVIPKSALKGRITSLSAERLEEACDALRYAAGC